jgi:hypothetical protein
LLGDGREATADHRRKRFSPTAVTDMRRPSIEIDQRDWLRPSTRPEDMGVAANNEDEIALGQLDRWSILERDAGLTPLR